MAKLSTEEFVEKHSENFHKKFKNMMVDLFDSTDVIMVVYRGYTPVWNDGDACEHNGEYAIITSSGSYDDGWLLDSVCDEYDPDISNSVLLDTIFDRKVHKPFSSHILFNEQTMKMDKRLVHYVSGYDLVRTLWDTNYMVRVYKKDGKVVVEHEEYNVDY